MSKLYVFGIGGTGSRVLRSLTMLLASGVKFGADEIVPIIVDPDQSNADLTRNISLLNDYATIRRQLKFSDDDPNHFFRPRIKQLLSNYTLLIKDTDNKTFRQFIDESSMSRENQALMRMLFSDQNLNSSMNVGFKGNPNIGSVVLNQMAHSEDFDAFATDFAAGDRIFIVSSIFGGTGASGFPLLLKTLRTGRNFANFNLINSAPIGAITILPYFKLKQNEESAIDSSTFISKAKSALAYYENNIVNNGTDALYFLADDASQTYENNEGGSAQKNDAHLIEFLGASAIVDFSNRGFEGNSNTANMELALHDACDTVSFSSFYRKMHNMLYTPMIQFTLMSNALRYHEDFYRSNEFGANKGNFNDFYTSTFYGDLTEFFRKYQEWLEEMHRNNRSLYLFNDACKDKPFDLVVGVKPKKSIFGSSSYNAMDSALNKAIKNCKSKEQNNKFLEMFYTATQNLVNDKLSN